jgi:hypothetical protein
MPIHTIEPQREIKMMNQRGDNNDESKQHIISVEQNMQSHVQIAFIKTTLADKL